MLWRSFIYSAPSWAAAVLWRLSNFPKIPQPHESAFIFTHHASYFVKKIVKHVTSVTLWETVNRFRKSASHLVVGIDMFSYFSLLLLCFRCAHWSQLSWHMLGVNAHEGSCVSGHSLLIFMMLGWWCGSTFFLFLDNVCIHCAVWCYLLSIGGQSLPQVARLFSNSKPRLLRYLLLFNGNHRKREIRFYGSTRFLFFYVAFLMISFP